MTAALSTAQVLFSVALGAVSLVIGAFALHVISTTMRTRRWYKR